jgi:hypothetical protein
MLRTLDPTYEPFTRAAGHADRLMASPPRSLEGIRLGLLANGKGNSEEVLEAVYRELRRTAGIEIVAAIRAKKGDVTTPPRAEVFERLVRESDIVLTAIGD